MRASIAYVQAQFDRFNGLLFGGHLPPIPVVLGDAAKYLGKCEFTVRRLPDGRRLRSDFRMRINTRIDLPETTIQDVIIHEMIHYFIAYHQLEDSSQHGNIFRAIMLSINTAHGRNVSIATKLDEGQKAEAYGVRKYHIVAVIRAKDGRVGIKVLPRVVESILKYYRAVERSGIATKIELYLTDHPFFNRYPTSSALKMYPVAEEELAEALTDAEEYIADGDTVRPK